MAHPAVVAEFIAFLFALMRSDKQLQFVSVQHFLCDVWPPVTPASSNLVRDTTVLRHRVTPQNVHYLERVCETNRTWTLDHTWCVNVEGQHLRIVLRAGILWKMCCYNYNTIFALEFKKAFDWLLNCKCQVKTGKKLQTLLNQYTTVINW